METKESKRYIEWSKVREWIENNWFATNPIVSDDEIDGMAISIAGEIDKEIGQARKQGRESVEHRQWKESNGFEYRYFKDGCIEARRKGSDISSLFFVVEDIIKEHIENELKGDSKS